MVVNQKFADEDSYIWKTRSSNLIDETVQKVPGVNLATQTHYYNRIFDAFL